MANLYFMADIISKKETKVSDSEPELTFENLQKAYDELLDDSQSLTSHYASLKKNFQKLSLEFENLKNDNEKLGHEKVKLLKRLCMPKSSIRELLMRKAHEGV